jgi:signal peptidase I
MSIKDNILRFFFPAVTRKLLARVSLIALLSYLFFGYFCIPLHIEGISMEPNYHDGSFNFCWKLRYLFSTPQRHDVVAVRFAGDRVMLLKRVVAFEGEQVEFRDGKLLLNGRELNEPYVRNPCDWDLSPRIVRKDSIYVIGDNRSMPIENHVFGNAPIRRIVGVPLW